METDRRIERSASEWAKAPAPFRGRRGATPEARAKAFALDRGLAVVRYADGSKLYLRRDGGKVRQISEG
jgi:hypothetical protein